MFLINHFNDYMKIFYLLAKFIFAMQRSVKVISHKIICYIYYFHLSLINKKKKTEIHS